MAAKPSDKSPTAAEHTKLRQFLQGAGIPPGKLNALVGANASTLKRKDIARGLKTFLKNKGS